MAGSAVNQAALNPAALLSFTFQILPLRVIFGAGCLEKLPEEIQRLGASKALILSTPEQRQSGQEVAELLGTRAVGLFDRAVMHVPIEIAEAAREEALRLGADCCVAVGGGSTTGLAKAIALVSELPILAIPTTYAGSEMTPVWGLTEGGRKTTGRDPRVLPKTVLYDPGLTVSMPPMLSATSGINSIAHCVEALYAQDANPIISMLAEEAIRAFAQSLPVVVAQPDNLEVRSRALYAAWLGGVALGSTGPALHHKLCHTLGGSFNLPHAETHTVVLPHAVAYNAPADMIEMDVVVLDSRQELRVAVQVGFGLAPVVLRGPVICEGLHEVPVDPVAPIGRVDAIGPARLAHATEDVINGCLRNGHAERANVGCYGL